VIGHVDSAKLKHIAKIRGICNGFEQTLEEESKHLQGMIDGKLSLTKLDDGYLKLQMLTHSIIESKESLITECL
jgi:hypothetical protein